MIKRRKWSLQSVKDELKVIHGNKYTYEKFTDYQSQSQKIDIYCTIHKKYFTQYISNHLKKKTECPECAIIKRNESNRNRGPNKIFSDFIKEANLIHSDYYIYDESSYGGSLVPMLIKCPKHSWFTQKPANHLNGKGCPTCGRERARNKLMYSPEEISELLTEYTDDKFVPNTYSGTKEEMVFTCSKHGEYFQKPMNKLRQNAGCPKCSTTKAELELLKLIPNSVHRDKKLISKEIDILNHEYNFGIEFNGLLWHSYGKGFPNNISKEDPTRHLIKTEKMEMLGYQLFNILDKDWNDPIKKEIWMSILLSKLGQTKRIFARKTLVRDLTNNKKFVYDYLNLNHLQGTRGFTYAYGLEYEGLIYSIMTIGRPSNANEEWEIIRFCNFRGTTVIGGASKLLKHFERKYKPTSIVSYAKRDWSQGNLYEKLNFKFKHNSPPGISWYNPDTQKLYSRLKFQKYKLKKLAEDDFLKDYNENITAKENMFNNKYRIYYDTGNKVYTKYYGGIQ